MRSSSSSVSPKVALHLLGGGITGAYFHYGVLAALDDHLSRRSVDMDIFCGSSAGSLVATTTAVGLKPQDIVEAILKDDQSIFKIVRSDIYRFSMIDWGGEVFKFFWTLFYILFLKFHSPADAPSFFWGLKDALPSGLFSLRYYEAWIKSFFSTKSLPGFFSQLDKELYIPSQDIDACKRVVFGSENYRHISFHKAIASSSAIPIFFKPVEIEKRFFIDGGLGPVAHLDIPASAGAKLIFLINPMVPIDNDNPRVKIKTVYEEKGRIKDKGFTYVADQALRSELSARVSQAVHHLGYQYPEIDVLRIEPDRHDTMMFVFNPMDFEARRQIVEYAYELTRRKLKEQSELWKRTLDRHSISLVTS